MTRTRAIRQVRPSQNGVQEEDFAAFEIDLPELQVGEVEVRPELISVDPYLAIGLRDLTFPNGPFPQGAVRSRLIGRVTKSRTPRIPEGDLVLGFGEWQERVVVPGKDLRVLHPLAPLPAYLGVLGHSGFTASLGMDVLKVEAGQTFSVSSAGGMVGLVAGQLARAAGARVIAIAGGGKAAQVARLFDFDMGIDYRAGDLTDALGKAAPAGIDRHFENVGASMLDPVLAVAAPQARIALCGLVAHYASSEPLCLVNAQQLLVKAITLSGFNIAHHLARYEEGLAKLEALYLSGALRGVEIIHHGLDKLPSAMVAMLGGNGLGKHLVSLSGASYGQPALAQ